MTRERAKELLPVIQAYANGKKVQICTSGTWSDLTDPSFTTFDYDYRIKPEPPAPVYVPLEWDDIPSACWVRSGSEGSPVDMLVNCVFKNGVSFGDARGSFFTCSWNELMNYQYSTDRVNWKPCRKEKS